MQPGDDFVTAALASDCDACRTAAGVARVNDKQWNGTVIGVRPEPFWTPMPMLRAEEMISGARETREAVPSAEEAVVSVPSPPHANGVGH